MPRLCILTPSAGYPERWAGDAERFKGLFGEGLEFRSWTDAGDLTGFGAVLPLLAWGYPKASALWYDALDAWEDQGVRFVNDIALLRWNTDKDYLIDLKDAGVATIPTVEVHGCTPEALEAARAELGCDTIVVKPSISAGAEGTFRIARGAQMPFELMERELLVQAMMHNVIEEGEYSLFYFGGALSHAVLKRPADGDFRVQPQHGGTDVAVDPPAGAIALAGAAIANAYRTPLYARIDTVRDDDGVFRLMELEAIEPALFLHHAPDGGRIFADAVKRAVQG
jgi:glutathione synthase/RimK-type ligase-like ATP-grasp enzyme